MTWIGAVKKGERRLFFSLRAVRAQLEAAIPSDDLVSNTQLASRLGVQEQELQSMATRLARRDTSLDQVLGDESSQTRLDQLPSTEPDAEEVVATRELVALVRCGLREVTEKATGKHAYVLNHRVASDSPQTLQQIGTHLRVSRERVRQIESGLLQKVRARLRARGVGAAA